MFPAVAGLLLCPRAVRWGCDVMWRVTGTTLSVLRCLLMVLDLRRLRLVLTGSQVLRGLDAIVPRAQPGPSATPMSCQTAAPRGCRRQSGHVAGPGREGPAGGGGWRRSWRHRGPILSWWNLAEGSGQPGPPKPRTGPRPQAARGHWSFLPRGGGSARRSHGAQVPTPSPSWAERRGHLVQAKPIPVQSPGARLGRPGLDARPG